MYQPTHLPRLWRWTSPAISKQYHQPYLPTKLTFRSINLWTRTPLSSICFVRQLRLNLCNWSTSCANWSTSCASIAGKLSISQYFWSWLCTAFSYNTISGTLLWTENFHLLHRWSTMSSRFDSIHVTFPQVPFYQHNSRVQSDLLYLGGGPHPWCRDGFFGSRSRDPISSLPLRQVQIEDVENEEKRNSLFLQLLEAARQWEDFQTLILLLQAWPPFMQDV